VADAKAVGTSLAKAASQQVFLLIRNLHKATQDLLYLEALLRENNSLACFVIDIMETCLENLWFLRFLPECKKY
jgi:hypothetical protein